MTPDADSTGRRHTRRPRRHSALLLIVLSGLVAIAVAFALASALDDDRPRGPYLIGAWTFGDRASLDAAVKAGAIDEVSADWLQSRADGSVAAPTPGHRLHRRGQARRTAACSSRSPTTTRASTRFDPAISAAVLTTSRVAAPSRRGGRRVVQDLRRGRRRRRLGGGQGLAQGRVFRLRRGARPATARRRPPHRRRRLPQDSGSPAAGTARARRTGRASGAPWTSSAS